MNGGAGPDLLGVCEVENRFVVDLLVDAVHTLLPARNYGLVHADTDDARGIDAAFVYETALLEVPANKTFFHVVMRRNATREIVQVNFRTHNGRTWSVFGNHWPHAAAASTSPPGTAPSPARHCRNFINRHLRSMGQTHAPSRWVTSTTSPSIRPSSSTR